MFHLPISHAQKLSHQFLAELATYPHQDGPMSFSIKGQTLLLSDPFKNATAANTEFEYLPGQVAKMLIFGEGLNLEKLHAVEQALKPLLNVAHYQIKPSLDGQGGLCLMARVTPADSHEVNCIAGKSCDITSG